MSNTTNKKQTATPVKEQETPREGSRAQRKLTFDLQPAPTQEACCGEEQVSSCCSSSETASAKEADTCYGSSETASVKEADACCLSLEATSAKETNTCCASSETTSMQEAEANCASAATEEPNTSADAEPLSSATLSYRVEGMDCPSCASTLEKGLGRIAGVKATDVRYPSGQMHVTTDGSVETEAVERMVQQLGYTPYAFQAQETETYRVHGMDCGACATTISKHMANVDGVRDVQVHFATGKMTIAHDRTPGLIVQEVQRAGYDAVAPEESNYEPATSRRSRVSTTMLSGLLLLAGVGTSLAPGPESFSILLYLAAIAIGGFKPAKSAYYAVKNRSLDMNVLMIGAAIGAALIGEYFEGALVVWLFALGNHLQQRSVAKTRDSIQDLMDLAPAQAWVQQNGRWVQQHVDQVAVGQTILIKPGEKIPLDGTIREGDSMIDQSPITGESLPVDKTTNDPVYAGTLNDFGTLEVQVTARPKDTTLARIIHLVEEAQEQRAPTETFVDRFAAIYTPLVFAAALGTMVLPPLFGAGLWGEWVYRGLALLVVACPCALVISTPVAIVSAIGNAAKQGVLIKGGAFLEAAGRLDALAFDKTGTLTEGKPVVEHVQAVEGEDKHLLAVARTLEAYSNHPIARAIEQYVEDQHIDLMPGQQFSTVPGKGVQGTIDGIEYFAGKPGWMEEIGVPVAAIQQDVQRHQEEGVTITIIGSRDHVIGYIGVADAIRSVSSSAIASLHRHGVRELTMLTGDHEGTAAKIAQQAQMDRYMANLLPENKVDAIRALQQEGRRVGMVGDGINDAPALATADIGIAMGGAGTATSMEAADVVLMADNLEKLPYTIRLSRKALTIIKQNVWFAILIKVVAIGLIVPDVLTLWLAVLSDTGAALIVILNSLRLFRIS
ncbi:heavy metal translocating P-type ATPase [Marinococcus halophilus]|uniref:heavy metal translocating P-type ATPase n=1 Tax=Marinococcus halophilus TaxID=1371 RepID=UPI0009A6B36E|nr:heavy metal translocating P-type ATPase [Marinococcus halophilus]